MASSLSSSTSSSSLKPEVNVVVSSICNNSHNKKRKRQSSSSSSLLSVTVAHDDNVIQSHDNNNPQRHQQQQQSLFDSSKNTNDYHDDDDEDDDIIVTNDHHHQIIINSSNNNNYNTNHHHYRYYNNAFHHSFRQSNNSYQQQQQQQRWTMMTTSTIAEATSTLQQQHMRQQNIMQHHYHQYQLPYHPYPHQQQRPTATNCCILDILPESLLAHIFFNGYLDSFGTIRLSSSVCRSLASIAKKTVVLLDLRKCFGVSVGDVRGFVSRYQNLTTLDFSYCTQFSNDHLYELRSLATTLSTLRLRGCHITDEGVVRFFTSLTNNNNNTNSNNNDDNNDTNDEEVTKETTIQPGDNNDVSLSPSQEQQQNKCRHLDNHNITMTSLEEIDLSAITKERSVNIGDASLEAIATHCPNLQTLLLGYCTRLTNKHLPLLPLHTPHLHHLDLSLCTSLTTTTTSIITTLVQLSHLHTLDISATPIANDTEALKLLARSGIPRKRLLMRHANVISVDILESLRQGRRRTATRRGDSEALELLDVSHVGVWEGGVLKVRMVLAKIMKEDGTVVVRKGGGWL